MRKELRDRVGRRGHFRATFRRFGVRRHRDFPEERTLLLMDVRDESGAIVTDHLWFFVGQQFGSLDLAPGDEVFFCARVTKYRKRNPDVMDDEDPQFVEDYRLSHPSRVSKLGAALVRPMPLFDQAPAAGGAQRRTQPSEGEQA